MQFTITIGSADPVIRTAQEIEAEGGLLNIIEWAYKLGLGAVTVEVAA